MFGNRLQQERLRFNLTQEVLAEKLDVKKNTVWNWEKDKTTPNAKQLMDLSAIGIDIVYLLTGLHSGDGDLALMKIVAQSAIEMPPENAEKLMQELQEQVMRRNRNTESRRIDMNGIAVILAELDDSSFQKARQSIHKIYIEYRKSKT